MDPIKPIKVSVVGATDLRNADGMMGKSDPFVEVKWRGASVLKTKAVQNNLNPTWANESFTLPAWTVAGERKRETERQRETERGYTSFILV